MKLKFHYIKTGPNGFHWPFKYPWAINLINEAHESDVYRKTQDLDIALYEMVKPYTITSANGLLDTITFPNEEEATAFLLKWM